MRLEEVERRIVRDVGIVNVERMGGEGLITTFA